MNKQKKLFKKGSAPVKNAEIKKEEEEKMKFSVVGGVKNAWENHKIELVMLLIIVGLIAALVYCLNHPRYVTEYRNMPVIEEKIVYVPVEPEQQEEAKETTERN